MTANPELTPTNHPTSQSILSVRHIKKNYGKRSVLKDINFFVKTGEVFGLFGPNGTGKTTCFDIVMGITKPNSGKVYIDSMDVTALPVFQRARLGLGYLPQESSIFRGLSLEQNIMAILEYAQPDKTERKKALEALLHEFSLQHIRKSPAIRLSGGEKRRLEIARCLAAKPRFILLDEPLAGIDPISTGDIKKQIRYLADRGIGVLITDHNVMEVLSFIDRACILHDGLTLAEGTPQEVIQNERVRALYLGDQFVLPTAAART